MAKRQLPLCRPLPLPSPPMSPKLSQPSPRKSLRKPSIVKSDSRSNVLPINLEDEVRRLAYEMSERRGFEPGHENEDWIAAEREVRQRYHQQSA